MEHIDIEVLRALPGWRTVGRRALMVTFVRAWGSSPRPIGSIMAFGDAGTVVRSVSGGCIKDDLLARYSPAHERHPALPSSASNIVKYCVKAGDAHRFGLPCGGTIELLLEFESCTSKLDELVGAPETGRLIPSSTIWRCWRLFGRALSISAPSDRAATRRLADSG